MFNLFKLTSKCMQQHCNSSILRIAGYTSARPTVAVENMSINGNNSEDTKLVNPAAQQNKQYKSTGLVSTVFAALKEEKLESPPEKKLTFTDRQLSKANTVDDVLSLSRDVISRQSALKIVSTLSQWSNSGKIQLSDFETDPRFLKLCRILTKGYNKVRVVRNNVNEDLSTVLDVKGDDEAAKLIASITVPQMIKVMSTLAQKQRRSTPLLQSLAYNLSRSTSKLDMKQCADILYCMSRLNFPETVLLERLSNDISENLDNSIERSAVVGSILTSLGLLRYRDTGLVESLSEWMMRNQGVCRPQDLLALFQTLAVLNYRPVNSDHLYEIFIPMLNMSDVVKRSSWVDAVWSLVVLNQANSTHISSVLNAEFIQKLQDECAMSTHIKILNINAVAQSLLKYSGPVLDPHSKINATCLARTKEKQIFVTSILESLKSLLPSDIYLEKDVSTGMGFLIDGVCVIDRKCRPRAITNSDPQNIRVAILALDYHDTCRGSAVPHGGSALAARLLRARGYRLLQVPFTEFSPRDKLVQRVQYLEKQLKSIASSV